MLIFTMRKLFPNDHSKFAKNRFNLLYDCVKILFGIKLTMKSRPLKETRSSRKTTPLGLSTLLAIYMLSLQKSILPTQTIKLHEYLIPILR